MQTLATRGAETICHISADTIVELHREGKLPASKIGGKWWQIVRIHSLAGHTVTRYTTARTDMTLGKGAAVNSRSVMQ